MATNIEIKNREITLEKLFENISNGKYSIPDFQRDYRWTPEDAKELWVSIYNGYPIGTLVFWKSTESYAYRKSDMDEFLNSTDKPLFIIDGQQRILSLLLSWNGTTFGSLNKKIFIKTNRSEIHFVTKTSNRKEDYSLMVESTKMKKTLSSYLIPIQTIKCNQDQAFEIFARQNLRNTYFDPFSFLFAFNTSKKAIGRIKALKEKISEISEGMKIEPYKILMLFKNQKEDLSIPNMIRDENISDTETELNNFYLLLKQTKEQLGSLASFAVMEDQNVWNEILKSTNPLKKYFQRKLKELIGTHDKKSGYSEDIYNLNTLNRSIQEDIWKLILFYREAKDFFKDQHLHENNDQLQFHHIYPFKKHKNSNFFLMTYIFATTNNTISDKELNTYFKKIPKKVAEHHFLPNDSEELNEPDFIRGRAILVSNFIMEILK